jgi:RNA polymerase sigma-70 factor, ECF subfamily
MASDSSSSVLSLDLAAIDAASPAAETLDEIVTRLFEQLRLPVYRYLVSCYRQPTDAEEITQEVFLRLYGALAEGQQIEQPRAWAFRVAHNLAVNRVLRRPPVEDVGDAAWSLLCQTRPDDAPSPEQRLLADERRSWVRARAAGLSELQRGCLLLRVEGFRYREIGEILGVSMSTVAESIRRGIRHLSRPDHA